MQLYSFLKIIYIFFFCTKHGTLQLVECGTDTSSTDATHATFYVNKVTERVALRRRRLKGAHGILALAKPTYVHCRRSIHNLSLITIPSFSYPVFFILGTENSMSVFPKTKPKCGLIRPQNTVSQPSVHLTSPPAQSTQRRLCILLMYGFLFT